MKAENQTGTPNVSGTTIAYDQLPNVIRARNIWIYGAALIIIFGTVGNVLSILVMARKSLRRHTTSLYLIVLAVVDTLVLYTGLLRYWIREVSGTDVRGASVPSCKIHIYSVYFLFQFEAWILVCVALERLAAIFVPLRAKRIFTKRFACIQLAITGVVLLGVNAHFFWTYTLGDAECRSFHSSFVKFVEEIWPWVDFVVASLAPFVLMFSMNIAIIARLVYLHNMRKKNLNQSSDTKMTTMTGILITVNFAFLITTAPIAIYLATELKWYAEATTPSDIARLGVVWASVNLTAYTNNAINFILYIFSGPRFRKELLMMLHIDRWRRQVNPIETSTTVAVVETNTQPGR